MRSNTNAECGSVRLFPAGRKAARLSERPVMPHTRAVTPTTKTELRKQAREKRKTLAHADIGAALAAHAPALKLSRGAIVGGYHALPDEADPALLLKALVDSGCHIAFPRMVAKDAALEFHRVPDGELLMPGAFGVHEPASHWPVVAPYLLLVPLLAFDDQGHRLGYGGGFYDRTLHAFRSGSVIRAIGIAYAGQQVERLPHEAHDMKLDAILTEHGLTRYTE